MWRAAIASVLLAACASEPVEYEVSTLLGSTFDPDTRLVFEGRLYTMLTETYVVSDYDELRDVAASVTVRANDVDNYVVLPFAASECGSHRWVHDGELRRIEVDYRIYQSTASSFTAYADYITCIDSNGETHTVDN